MLKLTMKLWCESNKKLIIQTGLCRKKLNFYTGKYSLLRDRGEQYTLSWEGGMGRVWTDEGVHKVNNASGR